MMGLKIAFILLDWYCGIPLNHQNIAKKLDVLVARAGEHSMSCQRDKTWPLRSLGSCRRINTEGFVGLRALQIERGDRGERMRAAQTIRLGGKEANGFIASAHMQIPIGLGLRQLSCVHTQQSFAHHRPTAWIMDAFNVVYAKTRTCKVLPSLVPSAPTSTALVGALVRAIIWWRSSARSRSWRSGSDPCRTGDDSIAEYL